MMEKIQEYIKKIENQCSSCELCGAMTSLCNRCRRWIPEQSRWKLNRYIKEILVILEN